MICLNFNFQGGASWNVKTQIAKNCLNFNFREGGGVLESQNPKCQDLPKFQFSGGGGGSVLESQNSKCQDLPKFQFWGGRGVFWNVKTQIAMICLNFNFRGGGSGTKFQFRGKLSNLVKNFWKPSLPLHHKVSHILRMWRLISAHVLKICTKTTFLNVFFRKWLEILSQK